MRSQPTVRGTRAVPGRAPQQSELGRVCIHEDCDTRLSRYNRRTHCHTHWPTIIPVQRGVEKKIAA